MRAFSMAVRFFRVVTPIPRLMVGAFAGLTLFAVAAILWLPGMAARAPIHVLVLQVFATSTGFAASARRGYYDTLVTAGTGRLAAGTVHWLMSSIPGVASCVILLIVGAAADPGLSPRVQSGTVAALAVTSTLPWATTVGLPRFSGAIGWLLVLVTGATLLPGRGDGVFGIPALTFLVYPLIAVGIDARQDWPIVVPGLFAACASMAAALAWIWSTDMPLEAGQ